MGAAFAPTECEPRNPRPSFWIPAFVGMTADSNAYVYGGDLNSRVHGNDGRTLG